MSIWTNPFIKILVNYQQFAKIQKNSETAFSGFAIRAESLPVNQESFKEFRFCINTKNKNSETAAAGFAISSPGSAPGNQESDQFRFWVNASAKQR